MHKPTTLRSCGPFRPSLRSFCGPDPRERPRTHPKDAYNASVSAGFCRVIGSNLHRPSRTVFEPRDGVGDRAAPCGVVAGHTPGDDQPKGADRDIERRMGWRPERSRTVHSPAYTGTRWIASTSAARNSTPNGAALRRGSAPMRTTIKVDVSDFDRSLPEVDRDLARLDRQLGILGS